MNYTLLIRAIDLESGERNALTQEEKQEYRRFKLSGCNCHQGMLLGGNTFHFGLDRNYFGCRANVTLDATTADLMLLGISAIAMFSKVTSLQNIVLTFPYFHNGYALPAKKYLRLCLSITYTTLLY